MRAHGEKDPILTNNGRSRQIIADFKEKSPFKQIDYINCLNLNFNKKIARFDLKEPNSSKQCPIEL